MGIFISLFGVPGAGVPIFSDTENVLWRSIEAPSTLTRSFGTLMRVGRFSGGTPLGTLEDSGDESGKISTSSGRQVQEFPIFSAKENISWRSREPPSTLTRR